jgi:hypothetical protein
MIVPETWGVTPGDPRSGRLTTGGGLRRIRQPRTRCAVVAWAVEIKDRASDPSRLEQLASSGSVARRRALLAAVITG